jgi:hypothetical protein
MRIAKAGSSDRVCDCTNDRYVLCVANLYLLFIRNSAWSARDRRESRKDVKLKRQAAARDRTSRREVICDSTAKAQNAGRGCAEYTC